MHRARWRQSGATFACQISEGSYGFFGFGAGGGATRTRGFGEGGGTTTSSFSRVVRSIGSGGGAMLSFGGMDCFATTVDAVRSSSANVTIEETPPR